MNLPRARAAVLGAVLALAQPASAAPLDGSLADRGATGEPTTLPATAIDAEALPDMTLRPEAPDDAPLPVYRLTEDTYFLYGNIATVNARNRGWNGNAGFVVTDDGVVVIDSLGTPELGRRLVATVRGVTDRPITHLILTHNHPDHGYGAVAFRELEQDVTVIGHAGSLEYINSSEIDSSVAYRRDLIPADMAGFEPVRPDITIDGELYSHRELAVGGRTFRIYNTGGHHSHGDLVVHQVDDGILWISDLAFNQRTTYMGDGDSELAIQGQNWLLENFSDARLMVPGHGSAQTPPFPMVKRTRNYMQRLRERIGTAIENGVGLQRAVENAEFEDWADTRLYEENHRKNANFVYRELEFELF